MCDATGIHFLVAYFTLNINDNESLIYTLTLEIGMHNTVPSINVRTKGEVMKLLQSCGCAKKNVGVYSQTELTLRLLLQ